MRNFFFFFLAFSLAVVGIQSHASERYIMCYREYDQLYFIMPQKIASIDKSKAIEYDITYITSKSAADVKMSFYSQKYENLDSVVVINQDRRYVVDSLNILYVEKDKKGWESRFAFSLDYVFLKDLYSSANSYQVQIYCQGKVYTYMFPKEIWKKEKRELEEIFMVIDKNIKL